MKAFPVLFLLTFILPIGASNRTAVLFDITKQTLDLFPSLRKMARSEDERKGPLTETAFKRISDVIANFRPRESLNILKSPEGGIMRRIADSLEPVLTPFRNLTAHVAGNRTISALFPKRAK
ncbi:uncharacterized protein LOC129972978 [Argiope bruennichi]|uniref:uncharacterized protein LOC129972978 n=1 Tax=Argiope bruennichi TaxID=94029 RepID=UPI0024954ABE|nr:uncharacterized protein LOC129972978 [Argiope bruennichi]